MLTGPGVHLAQGILLKWIFVLAFSLGRQEIMKLEIP